MSGLSTINVFDSLGSAYSLAFQTFLAHTDQKARAREWLTALVQTLPARRVLLDLGAGTGTVTAWLLPAFERAFAIEPNPALRAELTQRCPTLTVLAEPLHEARPPAAADLVLCSHVFYYLPLDS